jgi:predicted permease
MRTLFRRLQYWFQRRQLERDLNDEIETHRSLRQAQLEASGTSADDAAEGSRRALGNLTLARDDVREIWVWRRVEELMQDLRHGVRLLRRSPGFTSLAVLSLTLGIGANTAIFTLIDAVVLKSLPVEDPARLVIVERVNTRGERSNMSYELFEALRAPDTIFSGVFAALDGTYRLEMAGRESETETDPVRVQAVSGEYFQVLGVRAALGRLLQADDDTRARNEPVAVISDGFWRRRFAGDPSVISQRITVKGQSIAVIGVAPAQFFGESVGRAPDIWVPITMQPLLDPPDLLKDPRVGWLRVMARLQSGASLSQAEESMNVRLRGLKTNTGALGQSLRQVGGIALSPGSHGLADTRTRFSQQLWILMAVVGVVLLIACANVANLLLVRGAVRSRETAIRLAIGAGRGRLIRQFLTESVLLAFIGAAAGLVLARWGSQLLLLLASEDSSPLAIAVTPDARVLAFTMAISVVTVLLFGLAPAAAATRQGITGSLKTADRRARLALPRVLVIAQVGLSLLLLTGAGLFLQTFRNLRTVDLGFARDEIVQARVNTRQAGYSQEQLPELYRRLLERLSTAPGIRSSSLATSGFRTGTSRTCCIAIPGHIPVTGEDREIQTIGVTPDYFQTMGLTLVRGRPFDPRERDGAQGLAKVAIINETMARRYFGTDAAIGSRFGWGNPPNAKFDTEVIGVARNVIYGDLRGGARPLIYFPAVDGRYLIVRAGVPGALAAGTIRREVQAVDRNLAVDVRTVPEILDQALVLERLLAKLSGFFGAAAMLLAAIGIYGLMAYAVARRTKEIGIRVALGAERYRIVRQVFGETLVLAAAGVVLGLGAALTLTRLFASLLFGVQPRDPGTIGGAMLALLVLAVLAAVLPARRAARVEPIVALRQE